MPETKAPLCSLLTEQLLWRQKERSPHRTLLCLLHCLQVVFTRPRQPHTVSRGQQLFSHLQLPSDGKGDVVRDPEPRRKAEFSAKHTPRQLCSC